MMVWGAMSPRRGSESSFQDFQEYAWKFEVLDHHYILAEAERKKKENCSGEQP